MTQPVADQGMPDISSPPVEGEALLPLVRLRKKGKVKAPAFENWHLGETYERAAKWLSEGGGLGLALHKTTSWVIDFDKLEASLYEVAALFGECGCLVHMAPRGLHIFAKLPAPVASGRYVVRHNGLLLGVADVLVPPSLRNVVLPIAGTPREAAGGGVLWEGGRQRDGEAVTLDTMIEYLRALREEFKGLPEGLKFELAPKPKSKEGEDNDGRVGRWNALLGKDWRTVNAEEICAVMRSAQEGERHNTLLSLSALWAIRKLGDPAPLREAALQAFAGEPGAEKEVENILKTIPAVPLKLPHIAEKATEPPPPRGADEQPKRRSWGKSRQSPAEWLEKVFPEGASVAFIGGECVILAGGYAVNSDGLRAIAAARGVSLGKDKAEVLMGYAAANLPVITDAHIVRSYPTHHRGALHVYAEVEGRRGILTAKAGLFSFQPLEESAANARLFVMYTDRPRQIAPGDIASPKAAADEYLQATCALLRTPYRAVACAAAALASGAARGGLVVLGIPGSGKSTFSLFLQFICQGEGGFTSPADPRAFVASCANSGIVGIDESDTLSGAVQEMLKTLISYGRVNVRKMYTNAGLEQLDAAVSVVLSSVEVHHLASDLMRRMAVLRITERPRTRISEEEIVPLIRASASRYLVGCMYLCSSGTLNSSNGSLLIALNGTESGLPDYLASDSKRDWATAYYTACRRAGLSEYEIRQTWEAIRGEARMMGLGRWADVLEAMKANPGHEAMLSDGMTAVQIAELVIGCEAGEEAQRCARTLAQNALRAATALEEMGWKIEKRKAKNKLIYALKRINTNNNINNNIDNTLNFEDTKVRRDEAPQRAELPIEHAKDEHNEQPASEETSQDKETRAKITAFVATLPEAERQVAEAILTEAYINGLSINPVAMKLNQKIKYVIEIMNNYNKFISNPRNYDG